MSLAAVTGVLVVTGGSMANNIMRGLIHFHRPSGRFRAGEQRRRRGDAGWPLEVAMPKWC